MKPLWFKTKEYGWGWYPASWQGWAVLAAYIVAMFWTFRDVDKTSHSGSDTLIGFLLPAAGFTALLLVVCWKTGEKPRWRWGKDT